MRIRVILNTFYSGPQAWFFVAADKGYFAEEGLDVDFTPGDTLANAVPRVASGAFDIGYGDMNALIEMAAHDPAAAPIAVYVMHGWSPYTIAVAADGPVRGPADLAGRTLLTHPNDAALRMFPEFAHQTGLDPASPTIIEATAHHKILIAQVLAGEADGLFGFVNTLASAAIEAGIDPGRLRHFEWRTHVPDICGAAIIASQSLITESPDAVRGFVRAVNRAVADVIVDPDAGIAAVARRDPSIDIAANKARLMGTLAMEMNHPDSGILGLGDVQPMRLARAIALIAAAKGLPSTPSPNRIFTRAFLPPEAERIHSVVAV